MNDCEERAFVLGLAYCGNIINNIIECGGDTKKVKSVAFDMEEIFICYFGDDARDIFVQLVPNTMSQIQQMYACMPDKGDEAHMKQVKECFKTLMRIKN